MDYIQEEMSNKGSYLRSFELDGRSLRAVDQLKNLLGTTFQIWTTFGFIFRFIACISF